MLNPLARFLARPAVADWLIQRAMHTPYYHLTDEHGSVYMERYWLFNPYQRHSGGAGRRWGDWMPSIRIHGIMREDRDPHLHDHPWNARTFILRGWYAEQRLERPYRATGDFEKVLVRHIRCAGDTARLNFGEYHNITHVGDGGAWTLFVTWKKRGTWGFLVDGRKVPWREYLGIGQG